MLSQLTISNVALIKKQTIDFQAGFNCILGQSGAGKSIIIDALSFLLGAKADKTLLRSGESLMRVDGVFCDLSSEAKSILCEWEIECEDELVISRTLSLEGKSSVKVNGFPVTAKMLQALAAHLADFCGQHDSVGLLNASTHLSLLDRFVGQQAEAQRFLVDAAFEELAKVELQIASLGGDEQKRAREKDLLEFQIDEIEKAQLQVGEERELKERFDFISSAERIFEDVSDALLKLEEGSDNATSLLYEAKNGLSGISNFKDVEDCRSRLESCYYEVKDIAETLEAIKQNTEFDPLELERIDARLDLIKTLSKKYGKTVEDILDFQAQCAKRLEELENSQELLEKLQKQQSIKAAELQQQCEKLSAIRKQAAENFEKKICAELEDLEMKGTHFKVDFARGECSRNGFDVVKFMFSANVGQEIRDLHKTASGGELSRLLLAFKNVMLGREMVQTVVFDEIDAGISGHTAGKLAEKLVNISKYTQIICITHTPVVAAKAKAFLLVVKSVVDAATQSTVCSLNHQQAVLEVARLIDGGKEASDTAISHAQQLFEAK